MKTLVFVSNDSQDRDTLSAILPGDYRLVSHQQGSVAALEQRRADVIVLDPSTVDPVCASEQLVCGEWVPVVLLLGKNVEPGVVARAVRHGAFDCLAYPFRESDLVRVLASAVLQHQQEVQENLIEHESLEAIVGMTDVICRLRNRICRVASRDVSVLVRGKSGTGKELVARAVHALSPRRTGPFIPVNCAAIPDSLVEAELFGSEKGAFTDARSRPGLIESAHGGTLFLDEVGDMPLHVQAKLLRVIESRNVRRVGGAGLFPVSFRIVAATNVALKSLVKRGSFREDLFYRLAVATLSTPALAERKGDIPQLVRFFIRSAGEDTARVSAAAMEKLIAYEWPGNVRELRNVIERSLCLKEGDMIQRQDVEFA